MLLFAACFGKSSNRQNTSNTLYTASSSGPIRIAPSDSYHTRSSKAEMTSRAEQGLGPSGGGGALYYDPTNNYYTANPGAYGAPPAYSSAGDGGGAGAGVSSVGGGGDGGAMSGGQ